MRRLTVAGNGATIHMTADGVLLSSALALAALGLLSAIVNPETRERQDYLIMGALVAGAVGKRLPFADLVK